MYCEDWGDGTLFVSDVTKILDFDAFSFSISMICWLLASVLLPPGMYNALLMALQPFEAFLVMLPSRFAPTVSFSVR